MEKVLCRNCETENSGRLKFCAACGHELLQVIMTKPMDKSQSVNKKRTAKKPIKRPLLTTLLTAAVFMGSFYAAYQYFQPSYEEAISQIASDMNKTCPAMIDPDTRLDHVGVLPGNIIQYNYTLINMEQAQVNTLELRNQMEPHITQAVKTSPEMKFQRKLKATLNYYYQDKNGSYLFLISVTPDKYL